LLLVVEGGLVVVEDEAPLADVTVKQPGHSRAGQDGPGGLADLGLVLETPGAHALLEGP
jgi:hypothetical protein